MCSARKIHVVFYNYLAPYVISTLLDSQHYFGLRKGTPGKYNKIHQFSIHHKHHHQLI